MTAGKHPIWKRAALRGAGAAALLFVALEGLILAGKTTKLVTSEAALIALASGLGYAALWSVFALMVDRMLARVNAAARKDRP
jgi:hypothetical protein